MQICKKQPFGTSALHAEGSKQNAYLASVILAVANLGIPNLPFACGLDSYLPFATEVGSYQEQPPGYRRHTARIPATAGTLPTTAATQAKA